MRYVVGHTATARGGDAVNLAVALARRNGASLDLVMVLPADSPYNGVYPPEAGFESILAGQVATWLDGGLALIPEDVPAEAYIRHGDSEAEALIGAADELGAAMLVIGAGSTGLFKRFSICSVAGALLHAATVPVVLAPSGYSRRKPITRLTCALGARTGAQDVLRPGVAMARRRSLPLRLVSLVALGTDDAGATVDDARNHLHAVARNKSIFLGANANRILRALPVPMIVVPRNHEFQTDELFQTTQVPVVDAGGPTEVTK